MRKENVSGSQIREYLNATADDRDMPISKRRELANSMCKSPVFFSWDIPRTREGFYHYEAGLPAATKRAITFAPQADLLWLETGDPSVEKASSFAKEIRDVHPEKPLVYNLSPSFNWMAHGFTEDTLKSFIWDLAKHGYDFETIWQSFTELMSKQVHVTVDLTGRLTLQRHNHKSAL